MRFNLVSIRRCACLSPEAVCFVSHGAFKVIVLSHLIFRIMYDDSETLILKRRFGGTLCPVWSSLESDREGPDRGSRRSLSGSTDFPQVVCEGSYCTYLRSLSLSRMLQVRWGCAPPAPRSSPKDPTLGKRLMGWVLHHDHGIINLKQRRSRVSLILSAVQCPGQTSAFRRLSRSRPEG